MRRRSWFALPTIALLTSTLGTFQSEVPAHAAALKSQVTYVVMPHPDDEFEGWSLVQNSPDNFPVFILMTHGENTGYCTPTGVDSAGPYPYALDEAGELPPNPAPLGPRSNSLDNGLTCGEARLNSHIAAQNNQSLYDVNLQPLALINPSAQSGLSPASYGCSIGDTTFQEWVGGTSNAELIFNVGDGNGSSGCVTWAIQTARQWKSSFSVTAGLPEFAVIGAAYYSNGDSGCLTYQHPNHAAVWSALTGTDQGVPHQWTAGCGATANGVLGTRTGVINSTIWLANMAVNPVNIAGTAGIGNLQQNYGWDFVYNLDNDCESSTLCYDPAVKSGQLAPSGQVGELYMQTQYFNIHK